MDKIIKEIEDLFNSNLTDYRIAKDTGIALSMIQNYRNGSRKVENMTLKTAKKLFEYAKSLK
jgi:DNA-binding protein